MQVILDSSFVRPGSAPIWGGKKGEFRDWTNPKPANKCLSIFFPAVNWLTCGFVHATLSMNWLTRRLQTIRKKSNERTSEKLRC